MDQEQRTHFVVRDDADNHLAQPALFTGSLNPWFLTQDDSLGSSFRPAHVCDVTTSLSNREFIEEGTDRALDSFALGGVGSNATVTTESNQAVCLSSMLPLRRSLKNIDYQAGFGIQSRRGTLIT